MKVAIVILLISFNIANTARIRVNAVGRSPLSDNAIKITAEGGNPLNINPIGGISAEGRNPLNRNSIGGGISVEGRNPSSIQFNPGRINPVQISTLHVNAEPKIPERVSLENILKEEWAAFKITYKKSYKSAEEENFRREIFIENRQKIAKFNQEYGLGKWTFVQQLNNYADMLHHEFHRNLNGFNRSRAALRVVIPAATTFLPSANVILPPSVDWREVGAVSPVKSQELCAACWAFSAAGALEGHNFRKTGQLVELSAQNLIDCSTPFGNEGCAGGLMDPAYEYVKENPGIDTEASYPYEAKDDQCRFKPENVGGTCTGYVDIAEGDEHGLEMAVATLGPVSVAIDASKDTLQFYSDGIYFDPECGNKPDDMNHAVLVVGYGVEPDGQKYWLVKNSYGAQWGIGGYIKIAKDADNHCGIATQASYPLV